MSAGQRPPHLSPLSSRVATQASTSLAPPNQQRGGRSSHRATPAPPPHKNKDDAKPLVIQEGDPRDGLVVPLRSGVHTLPFFTGGIDTISFCNLSQEGVIPKDSCHLHLEGWGRIFWMAEHDVFMQDGVGCFVPKAICMLLPSVVGIVRRLPYIGLYCITFHTLDFVGDSFLPASSVT